MKAAAIVISNAGPLLVLGKLNRLELLVDLYSEVRIPRTVYDEAVTRGLSRGAPDAFTIRLFWQRQAWPIIDIPVANLAPYKPPVTLHRGEIEVLILAQILNASLVLFDDEVARMEARRLGLKVCGTLGILVQAYRQGLLTFSQIELLIYEIAARPDIWISAKLCQQVLDSL